MKLKRKVKMSESKHRNGVEISHATTTHSRYSSRQHKGLETPPQLCGRVVSHKSCISSLLDAELRAGCTG